MQGPKRGGPQPADSLETEKAAHANHARSRSMSAYHLARRETIERQPEMPEMLEMRKQIVSQDVGTGDTRTYEADRPRTVEDNSSARRPRRFRNNEE